MALPLSQLYNLAWGIFKKNIIFTQAGALTLAGALIIGGALTITGNLNITGSQTLSGTLTAEQVTSTDDALVTDLLTAGGVSAQAVTAVTVTATGTVQGEQITSTDDITATDRIQGTTITATDDLNVGDLATTLRLASTPTSDTTIFVTQSYTPTSSIVRVVGVHPSFGTITTAAAPIAITGVADGQVIMILGTDDTRTVDFGDKTAFQCAGDNCPVLGAGDFLTMVFSNDDSAWQELSRSDN